MSATSSGVSGQGKVHIAIAFIFASAIVGVTAVLGYFAAPLTSTDVLFIVMGQVGIAAFNGYYIGNVQLTAQGVQATTTGTA